MNRIFISYARSDAAEIAEFLYQRLSGCGYEVWKDDHAIPLGASFPSALSNALEQERDVILLITEAALKSEWVKDEIDMAMTAGRRVIPVILNEIKDEDVPLMIRKLNWLVMKDGTNDWKALHRLVDHLEGGVSISRAYNMSGHKDIEIAGVLVLGHSDFGHADLSDPASITEIAKNIVEEALPCIQAGAGIVPPGHPALACTSLAYLLGITNQMPRLFNTFKNTDGKFAIGKEAFVSLQDVRDAGFEYRSHM